VIAAESPRAGVVEAGHHIVAAAGGAAGGALASIEEPSQLGEAADTSRNVLLVVSGPAAEPAVRTGGAAGRAVAVGTGEFEAVGTRRAPVGIGLAAAGTAATIAAAGTEEAADADAEVVAVAVAVAGVEVAGLKLMAGPPGWGLGARPGAAGPAGRGEAVESGTDKGWGFPPGNSAFHFAGPNSGSPILRNNALDGKPRKKKEQKPGEGVGKRGVGRETPAPDTRRQAGVHPIFPSLVPHL